MIRIKVHEFTGVELALRLMNDDAFWEYAAKEWRKRISKFTPTDTGNLDANVTIRPKQIEYNAPYAPYVYHGEGMNFKRDQHPLASAHWDEAAKASELPQLIDTLQAAVATGRFFKA